METPSPAELRLEMQIEDLETVLAEYQALVSPLKGRVDELETQISAMESSLTWRLSASLWRILGLGKEKKDTGKYSHSPATMPISAAEKQFEKDRQQRWKLYPLQLEKIQTPTAPGLVSIIMPVYNGGTYLADAIESVLQQTYSNIELIIVNDGSTDDSGKVIDSFVEKDSRVQAYHQKNQKTPVALSKGFSHACGQYWTWTSADNILLPECIARLVEDMKMHPEIDMMYANIRAIDESGAPLTDIEWFSQPDDPSLVHFPENALRLNSLMENYIGAAFLYKSQVGMILGNYARLHFLIEDYEFWMRVNELFQLSHTSFKEPIYDFRVHKGSATSNYNAEMFQKAADLIKWDFFRRQYLLHPLDWELSPAIKTMSPSLWACLHKFPFKASAVKLRDTVLETAVFVGVENDMHSTGFQNAQYRILLAQRPIMPAPVGWDCYISLEQVDKSDFIDGFKGWYSADDPVNLATFIDVFVKQRALLELDELHLQFRPEIDYSCILPYPEAPDLAGQTLEKLCLLNHPSQYYEIIITGTAEYQDQINTLVHKANHQFPECRIKTCFTRASDTTSGFLAAAWQAKGRWLAFFAPGSLPSPNILKQANLQWLRNKSATAICPDDNSVFIQIIDRLYLPFGEISVSTLYDDWRDKLFQHLHSYEKQ